jgi:hypothetical protein
VDLGRDAARAELARGVEQHAVPACARARVVHAQADDELARVRDARLREHVHVLVRKRRVRQACAGRERAPGEGRARTAREGEGARVSACARTRGLRARAGVPCPNGNSTGQSLVPVER